MTIRGKEVDFKKCHDYFMGEERSFWRADLNGETIATMCKTKAECINEVRQYLKSN